MPAPTAPPADIDVSHVALDYLARGLTPIPLDGKRPALARWTHLQHAAPTHDEIDSWAARFPAMNVGIVTGHVSGIIVADIDSDAAHTDAHTLGLPETPTVRTGRGFHYYYAHPGGRVPNRTGVLDGVDVRGDGGYVVAPPSVHHDTGALYEWLPGRSLDDVPLAPPPTWLLPSAAPSSTTTGRGAASMVVPTPLDAERMWALLEGSRTGHALPGQLVIPAGTRNQSLTSIGGKLRRIAAPAGELLAELHRVNQLACIPPLTDSEIDRIARSVMRYPTGDVRARLRWLRECVARAPLAGRTAPSLRRVYDAHLDIACHARRATYTASVRQLAECADVHTCTVMARNHDLRSARLLQLVRSGAGARASTWRIPRDALLELRTLAMPYGEP